MAYEFTRNITDLEKQVSVEVAQGGANTPGIDLEQVTGGNIENIAAYISVPAIAGISDSKTITLKLQDSADGTNFTDVDPLIQTTIASGGGAGTPAKEVRLRFPPGTRRHVRVNQTITATAGTITGSVSFGLLF